VKRLVTVVILAILLVGLILLSISDTNTAIADTSISDNEVANGITKANNSPASAAITITMTGIINEQAGQRIWQEEHSWRATNSR
jgi:hypothetical protein